MTSRDLGALCWHPGQAVGVFVAGTSALGHGPCGRPGTYVRTQSRVVDGRAGLRATASGPLGMVGLVGFRGTRCVVDRRRQGIGFDLGERRLVRGVGQRNPEEMRAVCDARRFGNGNRLY